MGTLRRLAPESSPILTLSTERTALPPTMSCGFSSEGGLACHAREPEHRSPAAAEGHASTHIFTFLVRCVSAELVTRLQNLLHASHSDDAIMMSLVRHRMCV